jgi:hypothetical protein
MFFLPDPWQGPQKVETPTTSKMPRNHCAKQNCSCKSSSKRCETEGAYWYEVRMNSLTFYSMNPSDG